MLAFTRQLSKASMWHSFSPSVHEEAPNEQRDPRGSAVGLHPVTPA
jgi:hypothetical protein